MAQLYRLTQVNNNSGETIDMFATADTITNLWLGCVDSEHSAIISEYKFDHEFPVKQFQANGIHILTPDELKEVLNAPE